MSAPAVSLVPGQNPGNQQTPPTRRQGSRTLAASWGWGVFPLVFIGIFVIYPLLLIFTHAVQAPDGSFSFQTWSQLFSNPVFLSTIETTVRIALIATAISLVLGTFLATVMAFVPFRGVNLVTNVINIYLSFPSFLVTLALIFLWGNVGIVNGALTGIGSQVQLTPLNGQWGVIMAEVIFFTPFVIRPLLSAYETLDRSQIEMASALGATPARIVRRVLLPEAMPALAAGGSLVLMRAMNEFGIVLFTGAQGVETLPTLIYSQAIARGNMTTAAVAAVVNIILSVALYVAYRHLTARALGGSNAR